MLAEIRVNFYQNDSYQNDIMKKISQESMATILGGGDACAEALGGSIAVTILACCFITTPLAVAAACATARSAAICYSQHHR